MEIISFLPTLDVGNLFRWMLDVWLSSITHIVIAFGYMDQEILWQRPRTWKLEASLGHEHKKCLNVRQKLGTRTLSLTLSLSHSHSLTLSLSYSLTLDMLNNFCFHVYAQKSLSHFHTLSLSHSCTLSLFQSLIHSLSTYWTTFVFMFKLKSHCLYVKMSMGIFYILLSPWV